MVIGPASSVLSKSPLSLPPVSRPFGPTFGAAWEVFLEDVLPDVGEVAAIRVLVAAQLLGGLGQAAGAGAATLLATDKPVMMAPAMNVRMWEHAATQRNLRTLKEDGVLMVGPDEGEMACGEYGPGRMAEPLAIADAVESWFASSRPGALTGRRVLLTAGPTQEPLDPVRLEQNRRLSAADRTTDRILVASTVTLSLGGVLTLVGAGTTAGTTSGDAGARGASYGTLGLGLAGLTAGVALLTVGLKRRRKARRGTLVTAAPTVGPHSAGATFSMRF